MGNERIEHDALGEVRVPADRYWGAETQRAADNFHVSEQMMPSKLLRALALLKAAAAETNMELGVLDTERGKSIIQAAVEVQEGKHQGHFPVDIFQTGSGTSTNMNMNEVLANRANEIMGKEIGSNHVNAHDHVNSGQSSNDTIPSAIHIAAAQALSQKLLPCLTQLHKALLAKAIEFDPIVKSGRTHLQDAAPIRLGQEFSGYARQVELCAERSSHALTDLLELALGGTAVGTGLNARPNFAEKTIARIKEETRLDFREAANHFEAQGSMDKAVAASGALKANAVALYKIANDVRWLSSGPNNGLGEIRLPSLQPGSSIMPGKVNPVMSESMMMVCCQVIGNDAAITVGGLSGNFELNTFLPLIAKNLLESVEYLANACRNFAEKCVSGIEADEEACRLSVERNTMLVTALAPLIGHEKAAEIALEAVASGKTVRQVATDHAVLSDDELDQALNARKMTE